MHFLKPDAEGFVEVYDITIPVLTYIDNIALKDVSIKGKFFEYQLSPTASARSLTGLMLVENILFDIEKFVAGNFQARKLTF